jgi:hypothetical protein
MTEYSGFECQFRNGTYDFQVDETKMCRIPEFSEAWDIEDSGKAPRDDRHREKWKWLNETMFGVKFIDVTQRNLGQE